MDDGDDGLLYLAAGPLSAILLGMLLVPLRDHTTASNLTFVFMALTIAVSALGGRPAAVATALCSALSLDFFLTRPYLHLTIEEKHDVIAFVGLAVCGLIAATLGPEGGERRTLRAERAHRELLHLTLTHLEMAGPLESRLTGILNASRAALPLAAALVRDGRGQVVAASERAQTRPVPHEVLQPDTLLPSVISDRDLALRGLALPKEGARLALMAGDRQVGWLELWGNGRPLRVASRQTLSDIARLLAILVARTEAAPDPRA
jgi:K+-sensing histidine kinase KdpD